jgi:hypothetical protein
MSTGKPQGAKRRGTIVERECKKWLESRGYECLRTAGSMGRGDIAVAWTKDCPWSDLRCPLALLVEVKGTKRKPEPRIIRGPRAKSPSHFYRTLWWKPPGCKIEDSDVRYYDDDGKLVIQSVLQFFPEVKA